MGTKVNEIWKLGTLHGHCVYNFEKAEKVREHYRLPGATHISTAAEFKISRALVGRIVTYQKYAKQEVLKLAEELGI